MPSLKQIHYHILSMIIFSFNMYYISIFIRRIFTFFYLLFFVLFFSRRNIVLISEFIALAAFRIEK
jgi:hypothetical protein